MFVALWFALLWLIVCSNAQFADIPISRVSNGYFSDPYHVPYQQASKLHIAGTTHEYLVCDNGDLTAGCAHSQPNDFRNGSLGQAATNANVQICGAAGIHPFQSNDGSWDALVTLHVAKIGDNCKNGKGNWAVIVHAHPESLQQDHPPSSWIGDKVMIGSFHENVDANYDGKYFQTPGNELYLVYQKQKSSSPKRDGVVAWPMDNPTTLKAGSGPEWLLLPSEELNSENYVEGDKNFKLIETGNIRAIHNKFVMAYSVGAYNHDTYKIGIAWSDTFIPTGNGYRKVMKNNPDGLWKSKPKQEVYYLLQSEKRHKGWHYVKNQVWAPGVPTVAQIGADNSWVLLFAGYDPNDHPKVEGTNKYQANHRRPYFAKIDVKVPKDKSVKDATDSDLQNWITPHNPGEASVQDADVRVEL